jgi:hypothetical protein
MMKTYNIRDIIESQGTMAVEYITGKQQRAAMAELDGLLAEVERLREKLDDERVLRLDLKSRLESECGRHKGTALEVIELEAKLERVREWADKQRNLSMSCVPGLMKILDEKSE